MRSALKWMLALVVLLAPAASAFQQTADEVIEKHLAAIGGRAALGKLTSRKSTGTATFETPMGNLSGPYENDNKLPNKTRVAMTLDATSLGGGQMAIEQRFDGTNGYVLNSLQGDMEFSASQLENAKNAAFPSTLLGYKERGVKAELLPTEKVGGKDAIVLRLTSKTGPPARYVLDPDTYLILRIVTTIGAPQPGGQTDQTIEPSDYRAVDGVKVAFQVVISSSLQTIRVKYAKVEHNVAIDDAIFGKR